MQGKKGLIMGVANDRSIAWGIAKTLSNHGASIALTYQGDSLKKRVEPLAESINSEILIPCDVSDSKSMEEVFKKIKENLKTNDIKFLDEPYTRFKDKPEEQETFFIEDPHGNVLELKTFNN